MGALVYADSRRMRLEVEFHFAAAHRLAREGAGALVHGHNYGFLVAVEGDVAPGTGTLADRGEVKRVVAEQVLALADHRSLNDVIENPTAENVARWIWESLEGRLPGLAEVRLREVPDCCVVYRGPGGR